MSDSAVMDAIGQVKIVKGDYVYEGMTPLFGFSVGNGPGREVRIAPTIPRYLRGRDTAVSDPNAPVFERIRDKTMATNPQ